MDIKWNSCSHLSLQLGVYYLPSAEGNYFKKTNYNSCIYFAVSCSVSCLIFSDNYELNAVMDTDIEWMGLRNFYICVYHVDTTQNVSINPEDSFMSHSVTITPEVTTILNFIKFCPFLKFI